MARLAGLAGGIVLTASTIYLSTESLRSRTARNSATLRDCRARLDALREPEVIPKNPAPYLARPSLVETMKDRWNEEIVALWHCAVALDGVRIRESVEETVANVWGKVRG